MIKHKKTNIALKPVLEHIINALMINEDDYMIKWKYVLGLWTITIMLFLALQPTSGMELWCTLGLIGYPIIVLIVGYKLYKRSQIKNDNIIKTRK